MAHLGILQIFDHFPFLSEDFDQFDGQFRRYLAHHGWQISRVSVCDARGEIPISWPACDVWVVSGTAALMTDEMRGDLVAQLRDMAENACILATNGAEHLLHEAFAGPDAPSPMTPAAPRSVRNPFRSFWTRDRLYSVETDRVVPLTRPETTAGFFGFARSAA